jgi:2-polyprenyl-3-methyl-5-hydroxy-6-metoxy-1,4-benzoquinol methylase
MLIDKLIIHRFKYGNNADFYLLQTNDAIRWIQQSGVVFDKSLKVLDLGCGHGVFGLELLKRGCQVTFADAENWLIPEASHAEFHQINLDQDDIARLGKYDLVICSNVLEHLSNPDKFIATIDQILNVKGKLYLSWTNWLSPWGGHEFSPFHYLGTRRGHLFYDKIMKRRRKHTTYENLFPTYIGKTLKMIRQQSNLHLLKVVPRYYSEFSFLMHIPGLREFLAWNCALLIDKPEP